MMGDQSNPLPAQTPRRLALLGSFALLVVAATRLQSLANTASTRPMWTGLIWLVAGVVSTIALLAVVVGRPEIGISAFIMGTLGYAAPGVLGWVAETPFDYPDGPTAWILQHTPAGVPSLVWSIAAALMGIASALGIRLERDLEPSQ